MKPLYASADLGGTNIKCVIAGEDGKIVCEDNTPTIAHEGPQAVLDRIAGLVQRFGQKAGIKPAALGLGVPGLADLSTGVTRFLPNLPTKWRDVHVREALEPKLGCPVYILNDARMATFGELVYGHGRTANTMVFYGLGTGIGGGVVVDGRLRLGPDGAAGELGHQIVQAGGPLCGCGNRGCLETLASGTAMIAEGVRIIRCGMSPKLQEITEGDVSRVTPRTIEDAARAGDKACMDVILHAAHFMAVSIANMIAALHPDTIIIGGGVAKMGELLLTPIREEVRRLVHLVPLDRIRIETSLIGDMAGALGGIALASRGGKVG